MNGRSAISQRDRCGRNGRTAKLTTTLIAASLLSASGCKIEEGPTAAEMAISVRGPEGEVDAFNDAVDGPSRVNRFNAFYGQIADGQMEWNMLYTRSAAVTVLRALGKEADAVADPEITSSVYSPGRQIVVLSVDESPWTVVVSSVGYFEDEGLDESTLAKDLDSLISFAAEDNSGYEGLVVYAEDGTAGEELSFPGRALAESAAEVDLGDYFDAQEIPLVVGIPSEQGEVELRGPDAADVTRVWLVPR